MKSSVKLLSVIVMTLIASSAFANEATPPAPASQTEVTPSAPVEKKVEAPKKAKKVKKAKQGS
jgi:hypothetical protein